MKNEIEMMNVDDVILVLDWDPDSFHNRVSEMESRGYLACLNSYSVTADMNPETGSIIHLYSIEMSKTDQSAK